jgi:tetratricopeptide (TPR) repeat protein
MMLVVTSAAAEVAARLLGHTPFLVKNANIRVEPAGRLYRKHLTLGYAPIPGRQQICYDGKYRWYATHDALGHRITHPVAEIHSPPRPQIWLFGCSYTHGYSLNDEASLAWRLQERLPQYEIVNFAAPGYSTLHSVIQLREALAAGPAPRAAVLLYAQFHDERNPFLRQRRKMVAPFNRLGPLTQPYAQLGADGALRVGMAESVYREPPLLRHSALVNALDEWWNRGEANRTPVREISRRLLLEFAQVAKQRQVAACIAGIQPSTKTQVMLEACRQAGVATLDISFNYERDDNWNPADRWHPSPRANEEMAERLELGLASQILFDDQQQRLAVDPTDPLTNLYCGVHRLSGGAGDARDCLRRAADSLPTDYRSRYWLGMSFANEEPVQYELAERELRASIGLAPESAESHASLGQLLSRQGKLHEAVELLHAALLLRPRMPHAENELAWLWATCSDEQIRRPQEAVALAQSACRQTQGSIPSYLDTLAAALAATGEFEQAANTARQALRLAQQHGQESEFIRQRLRLYEQRLPYRSPKQPLLPQIGG